MNESEKIWYLWVWNSRNNSARPVWVNLTKLWARKLVTNLFEKRYVMICHVICGGGGGCTRTSALTNFFMKWNGNDGLKLGILEIRHFGKWSDENKKCDKVVPTSSFFTINFGELSLDGNESHLGRKERIQKDERIRDLSSKLVDLPPGSQMWQGCSPTSCSSEGSHRRKLK